MARAANYTIKGFLYQFNKTALEILSASENASVTVEGVAEDVEISDVEGLTAIQCKYHEASSGFQLSQIYKPLVQMMLHHCRNKTAAVSYRLYAYFPGAPTHPGLTVADLECVLASTDKSLLPYIGEIRPAIDLAYFLSQFRFDIGAGFDALADEVKVALVACGLPKDEIEALAYPNAIQLVAQLSSRVSVEERVVTRRQFVGQIQAQRKTAISKWTMALKSRAGLLEHRRQQLKPNLAKNARARYLLIDANSVEDYVTGIVLFIDDFLSKYHYKPAHTYTPLVCLRTTSEDFRDVQYRLYQKGVLCNDGEIGGRFDRSYFFREPLVTRAPGLKITREFHLRLIQWNEAVETINDRSCDDLFVIGDMPTSPIETADRNVEKLSGVSLKELKYVMGLANVYD